MSRIVEFLKSISVLAELADEELMSLASASEYKNVKGGQTVIFRGQAVDGLHIIGAGSVEVWVKPPKAKDIVKVADLGPGQFFGETSIIEESLAGATVKAGKDGAQLMVVPQTAFLSLLSARPALKEKLTVVIEARKTGTAPK